MSGGCAGLLGRCEPSQEEGLDGGRGGGGGNAAQGATSSTTSFDVAEWDGSGSVLYAQRH